MSNEIECKVKIRFSDCDPLGHLNNVRYLDYMLNAREDHVEDFYGFTYEQHRIDTGCTWVTIQNEIAYLKEVKFNTIVRITSKTIEVSDRTAKVELLMTSEDGKIVHAVLWITVIYFNVTTRKSQAHPKDIQERFEAHLVNLDQKDFQARVKFLRIENAKNS